MADEKNKKDDLDLDSAFDDDTDLDNLFDDAPPQKADKPASPARSAPVKDAIPSTPPRSESSGSILSELGDEFSFDEEETSGSVDFPEETEIPERNHREETGQRRRSFADFEPDMDALLITAQSSMIIEGMTLYTKKDFSAGTLAIYIEALKGVELYIKILDRNPNNYAKLKKVVDSDTDCQEVERIAFNLYKKLNMETPTTNSDKISAFEILKSLINEAVSKATISHSMKLVKKYYLLSGGLDEIKIKRAMMAHDLEFKKDINSIIQNIKLALDFIKKGNVEIMKGLRGRDLNNYITSASLLLHKYFSLTNNDEAAKFYARIHNTYKNYLIIR